jgi:hypothetical protein
MCLAWCLRERTERDVYVASTWHRLGDIEEPSRPRKLHTVKQPEGRAPAQIVVAALSHIRTSLPTDLCVHPGSSAVFLQNH